MEDTKLTDWEQEKEKETQWLTAFLAVIKEATSASSSIWLGHINGGTAVCTDTATALDIITFARCHRCWAKSEREREREKKRRKRRQNRKGRKMKVGAIWMGHCTCCTQSRILACTQTHDSNEKLMMMMMRMLQWKGGSGAALILPHQRDRTLALLYNFNENTKTSCWKEKMWWVWCCCDGYE